MVDISSNSDYDMFMKVSSEQFCEWKTPTPCCDSPFDDGSGNGCSTFVSNGWCPNNYPIDSVKKALNNP